MPHTNALVYEYHHIGIPTNGVKANERYSPKFKMFTADAEGSRFRAQWHRFEDESPLHPLIKTLPHVAFKVSDLDGALEQRRILLQPHSPFPGYRVAMIEDGGVPVEFVETTLSDEEIWSLARRQSDMYPEQAA
jgi:hypothetical protein